MIDKNPNVNLKYEILNWQKFPSLWYTGNTHTWPNAKCDLQNSPMYKMAQLQFSIDHNQALIKLHIPSYQYQLSYRYCAEERM